MLSKMENFGFSAPTLSHIDNNDDGTPVRYRVTRHLKVTPVNEVDVERVEVLPQPGSAALYQLLL
ncbi:hypothetical protein SAMN05192539_102384 [Paraburkholderia diazotrophica]|uniref:Uncharacterized protein n=1 Tax=Paraburkholderia diazotrophica TaxID=667676 RepID=A0A1H7CSY5_9BURK|nr:hypothetical protein SAMN05192539_102384 [Paraburkholderia diazotrophica]